MLATAQASPCIPSQGVRSAGSLPYSKTLLCRGEVAVSVLQCILLHNGGHWLLKSVLFNLVLHLLPDEENTASSLVCSCLLLA